MLKKFLFLFAAFAVVSCSSEEELPNVPVQELEEKNVEFQLYTSRNFSGSQFDHAYVDVTLLLLILDNEGTQKTLFEKKFPTMHFRDVPIIENKILEHQTIIYDKNIEKVYVSYGLNFNVDGMRSSEGFSYSLPNGETRHIVSIDL